MTTPDKNCILTINGGSSSIKFSLYTSGETPEQLFAGEIESMGTDHAKLTYSNKAAGKKNSINVDKTDAEGATNFLIDWLEKQPGFDSIAAIGHRIVHGMSHTEPERITTQLLEELKKISTYDPEHLPGEIKLIEIFTKRHPLLQQIACFDTSFHTTMPNVATMLPIPRRYNAMGIKKYGFHGLSYSYLIDELKHIAGNQLAMGKVIMAHLGNGASLAAIQNGRSIDTSMGFTPAAGIPMSTRTGDLDPGVAWYLMQEEKMTPEAFSHLINHESGLLGVSATSSDMRDLLQKKDTDSRAAEAIDMFCYQTKKWIGAFAASLGGVDAVVFSGGIGEHVAAIREGICNGLEFLGIHIDTSRNENNETIISHDDGKVKVYVIKTNEELMIARLIKNMLN